jgi:hypothetical protein
LSNISTTLPKAPTFFLDRSLGAEIVAGELRSWDWPVEVHRSRFKQKTEDGEWITVAGEKHWRIITSDKDLECRYHEAIVAAKAAIFVLSELKRGEGCAKWIEMLRSCKQRIIHDAHFAPRPFVARVSRDGNIYQVTQLFAHGKTRNVTHSVASNFRIYCP